MSYSWKPTSRNGGIVVALDPVPGTTDLALTSPYDRAFVDELKAAVGSTQRRWDKERRQWIIAAGAYGTVSALVRRHFGVELPPMRTSAAPIVETRLWQLDYLGAAKERQGSDELVAYGYADGDWRLSFPVSTLRSWFLPGMADHPSEAVTLYGVLGVARDSARDDIKAAYRRAARQWHPDVCREPDAGEQMTRINHAWTVLGDELMRRKYDAGLRLTTSAPRKAPASTQYCAVGDSQWRPPLRCGLVLCEGSISVGRFVVSRIVAWHDVIDAQGRVMVTSWPRGADMFVTTWAQP